MDTTEDGDGLSPETSKALLAGIEEIHNLVVALDAQLSTAFQEIRTEFQEVRSQVSSLSDQLSRLDSRVERQDRRLAAIETSPAPRACQAPGVWNIRRAPDLHAFEAHSITWSHKVRAGRVG